MLHQRAIMLIIFWVFYLVLGNDHGSFALRQARSMIGNFKNHPYFIFLQSQNNICGGSLIAQNSVLTSANCCLTFDCDSTLAMSGYVKVNQTSDQAIHCKELRIHPQYKASPEKVGRNDLCVITLQEPFELTPHTRLVNLGTTGDYRAMLEKGVVEAIGYGDDYIFIGELGIWSKYEMEFFFHLNARVYQDCKDHITHAELKQEFDLENMFCTKGVKYHCIGDSGGPAMFNGIQVGVGAWGWATCKQIRFTVYTRVDTYMDFINKDNLVKNNLLIFKSRGHALKNVYCIALYVGAIRVIREVLGSFSKG